MKLNVLVDEDRFIVGPSRLDSPLNLPPIYFGDILPIELRVFRKGSSGVYALDVSTYQITLRAGPPNSRAELGFWQLITTLGSSKFINSRASEMEVQAALSTAFGPGATEVKGGQGSYIITLAQPGFWALPTATFQGDTSSIVSVSQITPGTVNTPAQYRVEVLEVAPARIIPENWTAGDTVPVSSFTQISGKLWELTIDPNVDNGFFTLIIDGNTSRFTPLSTDIFAIQKALALIGKPAEVMPNGTGGFWVSFIDGIATAVVGGNLVILPFQQGNLDLTSSGVRELLDGLQFADIQLSIQLVKDGETVTVACTDIVLEMPINQPTA